MVFFKTTAKFSKSMEFFKTLGDMDQVNGPIGPDHLESIILNITGKKKSIIFLVLYSSEYV